MPVPRHIIEQLKQLIPPLNGSLHKVQSGRVGVLGGALEFLYGCAVLRLYVCLAHWSGPLVTRVICSPTAAGAIKSYSPDLIVHPILREEETPYSIKPTLSSLLARLHVLVLGPGLGREDYMVCFAMLALKIAKDQGMYVVLDADALWMIGQDLALIRGYRRAVLTPHIVEFKRLSENVMRNIDPATPDGERAMRVSFALGDARLSKVPEGDWTEEQVDVDVAGGLKRCGGQGDILSGTVFAVLAPVCRPADTLLTGAYDNSGQSPPLSRIPLLAAVGGSMVTRTASKIAFAKHVERCGDSGYAW
ncbi:ATP-dependent (S)-NAD(P)H-hydrate dehydratase [Grifola frondosa]|uniref:ATP-dependent (S)-NAD(P)H-hydrate dehydratase n=1 Tax=Grifola frondosa TaxID=5627 RepID=A0A1C7MBC1_GRIFR|nr:ATP-dependent (S)-NAD(P)H-hydrate dehydratase [Grifola frondosa]